MENLPTQEQSTENYIKKECEDNLELSFENIKKEWKNCLKLSFEDIKKEYEDNVKLSVIDQEVRKNGRHICKDRKNPEKKKKRILTPEQKERSNQYSREYMRKLSHEVKAARGREYRKKLTPEQKKEINKRNRQYRKNLSPEKKKEKAEKNREYQRKITPEKRKEMYQKQREYYKNLDPEKKQVRLKRCREHFQNLSFEKLQERARKKREYYENLSPEKKEEQKRKQLEYRRKQSSKRIEQVFKNNKKVKSKKAESTEEVQNLGIIEEFSKDLEQGFCYTCRMQFVNNSVLLEHITKHVTLPSISLTRIDKHKLVHTIKMESENTQINSDLFNDTSQNAINIKPEYTEHDEDIKHEVNNIHMDVKTETDIEVDYVTFYTYVKKEEN